VENVVQILFEEYVIMHERIPGLYKMVQVHRSSNFRDVNIELHMACRCIF
jgi:hypothetical protein